MVADASNRHSCRYIGLLLAWAFACWVIPSLASAAEDNLLTIEPTVSMQQMRQRHDPALQAILHVPAFGTLHLAHARAELLSDRADAVRIDLGDGRVVIAHKVRFHIDADGVAVWEGEIQTGGPRARRSSEKEVPFDESNGVTLAALRGSITGSVRVAGQLYKIMPLSQGEHAVVKVDEHKLSEGDDTETGGMTEETAGHPPTATRSPDAISTIRVLVVATRNALDSIGDENAFRALAAAAFAEANRSFANSDLPVRLESDGVYPLAYVSPAGMTSSELLAKLRNINDPEVGAPTMRLRDEHRADVVVMLITDSCGKAYVNATKATAYAVVGWHCATGNYTFAHEIGHNLGTRHDPDNNGSSGGYPYGFGYQQRAVTPRWRTIMAYSCSGVACGRINYWSDPSRTYNGVPIGLADLNDNARVWRERAPVVAAFYPDPAPMPPVASATATPTIVTGAQTVTLDGSHSSNPNGGALRYEWVQTGGAPAVDLSNSTAAVATAAMPAVGQDSTFRFRLIVTNRDGLSASAVVDVSAHPGGGDDCMPTDPEAGSKPAWNGSTAYNPGDEVQHNGVIWRASWQTIGRSPDKSDAFELVSNVPVPWDAARPYAGNNRVIYEGKIYRAQHWVGANARPGVSSVWVLQGEHTCP